MGTNPPRDAHGSCFESPEPPVSFILSTDCCGYGGANTSLLISTLLHGWSEHMGTGASHPSLIQKVMPLALEFSCWRYWRSCKEHSAPQEQGDGGGPGQSLGLLAMEQQGGASRQLPRAWRLLAKACPWHVLLSGAQAKDPDLGFHFIGKKAVKMFFFCSIFVLFSLVAAGLGLEPHGGCWGNTQRGEKTFEHLEL